jgi:hypothetical protein
MALKRKIMRNDIFDFILMTQISDGRFVFTP